MGSKRLIKQKKSRSGGISYIKAGLIMAKTKKARPKNANGDGSIRQRPDGRWELRATVGKGIDGKQIRKSFYGDKQSEVKLKYKNFLAKSSVPIDRISTVKEWAEFWLEISKKDKISYKGYYNYTLYINNHIIPEIGDLALGQVRPAHIEKLLKEKQKLSYSAQHHILMILKIIFKSAIKNHLCVDDPTEDIKITKEEKLNTEVFSTENINDILEAAEKHEYGFYIQSLLYSGMRMGELRALKWEDIDLKNDIIHIARAAAEAETGEIIKSTKTKKDRYVGINKNFKKILLKQYKNKTSEFVIAGDNDGFLRSHQFGYRYRKFFKDNNIPYLSPHKCRHTYATYLVKNGTDIRTVQELLGHVKINTTQRYTQVDMDMIKSGVKKLKY